MAHKWPSKPTVLDQHVQARVDRLDLLNVAILLIAVLVRAFSVGLLFVAVRVAVRLIIVLFAFAGLLSLVPALQLDQVASHVHSDQQLLPVVWSIMIVD